MITAVESSHDWPGEDGGDSHGHAEEEHSEDDHAAEGDHSEEEHAAKEHSEEAHAEGDHSDEEHSEEEHDHSGHDHIEGFNEHVWYDPHTIEHVAEHIAEELGELDAGRRRHLRWPTREQFAAEIAGLEASLDDASRARTPGPRCS